MIRGYAAEKKRKAVVQDPPRWENTVGRQKADHRPHLQAIDGSQLMSEPPIDLGWMSFPILPASSVTIYSETVHLLNNPVEQACINFLWLQLSFPPKEPHSSAAISTCEQTTKMGERV